MPLRIVKVSKKEDSDANKKELDSNLDISSEIFLPTFPFEQWHSGSIVQQSFVLMSGEQMCAKALFEQYDSSFYSVSFNIEDYPAEMKHPEFQKIVIGSLQSLAETNSIMMSAVQFLFQIKNRIKDMVTNLAIPNFRLGFIKVPDQSEYILCLIVDRELLKVFKMPSDLLGGYAMVSNQEFDNCIYPLVLGYKVSSENETVIKMKEMSLSIRPKEPNRFLTIQFSNEETASLEIALSKSD